MGLRKLLLCLALAAPLFAQTYAIAPDALQTFLDNNGQPLAGGQIWTCLSGTTCPGNPLPTYTTSTGGTPNTNPVILDAYGRASIWLLTSQFYKFVIATPATPPSIGTIIKTVDGLSAASGGSSPVTNFWTLSGSSIANNNGSGVGAVNIGADLNAGGNVSIVGGLKLASPSSGSPSKTVTLTAPNAMAADVTWRWAATDGAGCLVSDGAGNLSFAACGGGSGSPGTPTTSVQFNNGGLFGGSANFEWINAGQKLVIAGVASTAGLQLTGGAYYQADGTTAGYLAATATTYNTFNAPTGGASLRSLTASKYIQTGNNSGTPTVTGSDTFVAGALYFDTGSVAMQVYNGSAWVSLGGGTGSPGGANTNVQYNSSGSFAGSGNFVWNNAGQKLVIAGVASTAGVQITGGAYFQSDGTTGGYLAGTATTYNTFQAPTGGVAVRSVTATKYVQTGNNSGVPSVTGSDAFAAGALYYDTMAAAEQVFDGVSWVTLAAGGSTSPGAPSTSVQYNSAGSFAGSANFEWNNAGQKLVIAGVASTAAIQLTGGAYYQADGTSGGYLAGAATTYNTFQAPTGGAAVRSVTATKYVQTGNGAADPTVTGTDAFVAGAMYYNTISNCEMVYGGASFACISAGGGGSPGTPVTSVQFNNAGSFGGSSNFTWVNGSQQLVIAGVGSTAAINVTGGAYIQATGTASGFNAPTANTYNAIQAPSGGMLARNFVASAYVQTGSGSSNPTPTSTETIGLGAMYYNTVNACETLLGNAGWACIGGGGGTPGGSNTSVQFNNSGAFGGTTDFAWTNTGTKHLDITTTGSGQGLHVIGGYVTADVGFNANAATAYNSIQAPSGGAQARSFTASKYVQSGNNNGIPTVTTSDTFAAGALYYDTGLAVERVYNGAAWVSLATGGVTSLNTLTGVLSLNGTANQVNVASGGSTVTLSTPQNIATSSSPTFAGLTTTSAHTSNVTGTSAAFNTSNGNFSVSGNGVLNITGTQVTGTGVAITGGGLNVNFLTTTNSIQTTGGINSCTTGGCSGGSAYSVNGSTVITSAGYYAGPIATPTGGLVSQVWIGPTGNLYTRPIAAASTTVSCGATLDGWLAVTNDSYIVVCFGGARFRSSLVAF